MAPRASQVSPAGAGCAIQRQPFQQTRPAIKRFPSIQALRAIESVERNGALWRAAAELNVTRSAVSHQLRLLETDLGFKILERNGNRTEITPRARAYAEDVRRALSMIATSTARVSQHLSLIHI